MPVIKQRLTSGSVGPVGVRSVNTGGVEKYSSIGRAANQIVQASVKEMGVQAVKEGEQLAFQADSKSIININPFTGKPEALNQLNGEGFLGRAAGEAYQRVILDRYQNEVSIDIQRKTNELILKYQDDPDNIGKVTGALNEYLKNMAFSTEENGKPTIYTNYVEQQGALELAKAELSLGKLNASRQRTKLGEHILLSNKDDKETAYEFGKTNQDSKKLEAFIEARVAKNKDGEAAFLLEEGTAKRHGIALQVAYVFGKIEGLYPKFMMNDYQRTQFELAIRTDGKVTTNLNDEYLDDLEDVLKFTKDLPREDLENVMAFAESLSGDYRKAEDSQLEQRRLLLEAEEDKIEAAKTDLKVDYNTFKLLTETDIGRYTSGTFASLDTIYDNFTRPESNSDALAEFNVTIASSLDTLDRLQRNFQQYIDAEVPVDASLITDIKSEELKNYLTIAARDGNIDSLRLAIISPDADGFQKLTSFQKHVVRNIKASQLYDSNQTETVTSFLSDITNKAEENINNYISKKQLQAESYSIAQAARSNSLTEDEFNKFSKKIITTSSNILTDSEKDNIENSIKLAGAEGIINNTQNASSLDLNAISLFVQSDGKSKDPSVVNLSEANKEVAETLNTIVQSFPNGKDEIIRKLQRRETDIKTAETDREKEKKKLDDAIKLRRETIQAGNTNKTKEHREDMDKVMIENLGISSAADPKSTTPSFYQLSRVTLPESLVSGLKNFLSGTAPEVDADTLLKHANVLMNDRSPSGTVNRFGDVFGKDTALLREVARRKAYFGDEKTANEILLEIKEQANSPTAKINRDRVFSKLSPVQFVEKEISSDTLVVADLAPIAEMYAEMGKTSQEIIEELTNYFDENYKPSEHVIDPNSPFVRGESVSKMSLDIVFPDEEEKAEFIKLVNQELPRGFSLGPPQDISYIQKTVLSTRSGKKRETESTIVTGQTKEVFLVPFDGGDVPQFYAYFRDENNEIRPLIYENKINNFGASELTWPMFDTSMTEDFAKNKHSQLLRSIQAEAREAEREAREQGAKPLIPEDSVFRRLPIVKFYGWELP
jgi:hypothetical protein